jgi:hypothetical protein
VTRTRPLDILEGVATWKIDQLPSSSAGFPPGWYEKTAGERRADSQVTVKDFRRIHLVLVGDFVQVHGTCCECHHCILGTITILPQDPDVFDLICPHCKMTFCRVGNTEQRSPDKLAIHCICGAGSHSNDLIFCEGCETWQHSSCYYDGGLPPRHQCRNSAGRRAELPVEVESSYQPLSHPL